MTKAEFFNRLACALAGLGAEDIQKSLEYYDEMLQDRIEDGMTEEEAVASLEEPEAIARQIMLDTPLPKSVRSTKEPARRIKVWEIILLVLGAPVWLPLLLTLIFGALTLYLTVWIILLSFYATDLSLLAVAVFGLVESGLLLTAAKPLQSLFYFGAGIACFGLAVLLFFAFNKLAI